MDCRIPIGTDFNPRIPCGMRRKTGKQRFGQTQYFNPRIPCGMRPLWLEKTWDFLGFQSTHPMRDATQSRCKQKNNFFISIHASHAGCDYAIPLRAGKHSHYFNPRIPCGMRLDDFWNTHAGFDISIHASHAGCDLRIAVIISGCGGQFQSTHPMRDATSLSDLVLLSEYISIHASHAGCDVTRGQEEHSNMNFNPRIPCGMRRKLARLSIQILVFQSTHPMRDATGHR